jgi:hypothetical protein
MIPNKTNNNQKKEDQIWKIKKNSRGAIEKHLWFDKLFID